MKFLDKAGAVVGNLVGAALVLVAVYTIVIVYLAVVIKATQIVFA